MGGDECRRKFLILTTFRTRRHGENITVEMDRTSKFCVNSIWGVDRAKFT